MALAAVATFIGLVVYSAWQSLGEFGLPFTTALMVYSSVTVLLGFLPALVVSLIATFAIRRLAPHAGRWWTLGVAVLALCGLACLLMLPASLPTGVD
jgi:hypothetical protein